MRCLINFATFLLCLCYIQLAHAGTKSKRHGHNGVLDAYDGKPIKFEVSLSQLEKLDKGEPVTYNERVGKSGRGVVIQDINATVPICMDKIRDLTAYPKMVPNVKSVTIYSNERFRNGTSRVGAQFDVGALGLRFGYYLLLTHEPKYNTLTWTLDYKYNSDFDDNVGHWQVMPHPKKKSWTRVLYSIKVKLFPWIPEFIVNFLTGKALVESTTWLKRESEAEARRLSVTGKNDSLKNWFHRGGSKWANSLSMSKKVFDEKVDKFRSHIPSFSFSRKVS